MWLKEYLGSNCPTWCYYVDALFAMYVPEATIPWDKELRINQFTQTWRPYKHRLPKFMRALTEAAEKWGLRPEGLAFSRQILCEMTMWYHCEADPSIRRLASHSNASKCLRLNHKLRTVGDFEALAAKRSEPTHRWGRNACACDACEEQRLERLCDTPDACYAKAEQFLDTLPPKWDPRGEHPEDYEDLLAPPEDRDWTYFDWRVTTYGSVSAIFRIFTEGVTCNARLTIPTEVGTERAVRAATDGSCLNNGERNARAGAGVCFETLGLDDISVRLPLNLEQSNQSGEMTAAKLALEKSPEDAKLLIETDSKWALGELTTWQRAHESTGYIEAANAELTKVTVARLRNRRTHTAFKWVKGHAGHEANERADKLAGAAAERDTPDEVSCKTAEWPDTEGGDSRGKNGTASYSVCEVVGVRYRMRQ
ncbi:ribonuclease H-like domain-containing protein [Schizophyllum fasciatum]